MAKKSKRKNRGGETVEVVPMRPAPNWPLLGLALVGIGLTGYLTATTWSGSSIAGCAVGSGCDVVLTSRWATLLGLPTSLWGLLAYAALAGIAFVKRADIHAKLAWCVALLGVLYSLYLSYISITRLGAACPYCLSSLSLLVLILGLVSYQWPPNLPGFSWSRWSAITVAGGLALVFALHLHYGTASTATQGVPEDPKLRALAEHLAKEDVKFYGAEWCPHCQTQKAIFGASAHRLPYIECSPKGPSAPQASICRVMSIRSYPTWIIKGRRYTGELSLKELARLSGYQGEL